jgi:hypothetical protein
MKHYKSERLKKLEAELTDLEQWLKLGLVPKRDINKHKEEISNIKAKIDEEKERLSFLKESGEGEEYTTPKRAPARAGYTEMPTIPDIDAGETAMGGGSGDTHYTIGTETGTNDTSIVEEKDEDEMTATDEEDSNYFNPNRWREGIVDPDADEW